MKNLRKFLVFVLAIVAVASFGLVGCGKNNSGTGSVKVTAYTYDSMAEEWVAVRNKIVDNNNNLPLIDYEPEAPDGKEFYGWSTSQNWEEGSSDFVIEGSFISYNKVKDAAKDGKISLYPAFKAKVEYYFVFGIYTRTATSGLGADDVAAIKAALLEYLEDEQGATAEQLALVDMREYSDSTVATYGAKIMHDGDVDVLLGCGKNIASQGGVEIVVKNDNDNLFSINGKTDRVFTLLNYKDLSVDVYNWFQTYIHDNYDSSYVPVDFVKTECTVTYALGENAATDAVVPQEVVVYNNQKITLPEAPEGEGEYFFSGWQVGSNTKLKAAGAEITITEDVTITAIFRSGYNISYSKGLVTRSASDATVPTEEENLPVGTTRTLPAALTAKAGFKFAGWQVNDEETLREPGAEVTLNEDLVITAVYEVDITAVTNTDITIGYYANANGGFTENDVIMTNVINALKTYLTSAQINAAENTIQTKAYTGNVGTAGNAILADLNDEDNPINVGIVLGFAGNLATTGHISEYKARSGETADVNKTFTMGTATGRYVYRLTDNAIANIVYDWMVADGSTFVAAVQTPAAD